MRAAEILHSVGKFITFLPASHSEPRNTHPFDEAPLHANAIKTSATLLPFAYYLWQKIEHNIFDSEGETFFKLQDNLNKNIKWYYNIYVLVLMPEIT